jgi:hypothetical protein
MRKTFILVSLVSLIACRQPSPCNEGAVRQHVVDSLKALYELQAKIAEPAPEWYQGEEVERSKERIKLSAPTTIHVSPGDTTYTDNKGNVFPLHFGKKGGKYIIKTSKTTGKEYKQYLK